MSNISPSDGTTAAAAGDRGDSRLSTGRNGLLPGELIHLDSTSHRVHRGAYLSNLRGYRG